MNEKFQMLKDVAVQTAKDSRAYGDGYRDGYLEALDDVEQVLTPGQTEKKKELKLESIPQLVVPVPCTKGMKWKTVKDYLQKFNEEADEYKQEILSHFPLDYEVCEIKETFDNIDRKTFEGGEKLGAMHSIAEEAADVATVLASMMEAMGIGLDIRMGEQAHVNKHNHQRGRN